MRSLLEDYFGIRSKIYPHYSEEYLRKKPEYREKQAYTLVISRYENLRKFRDEIGFDHPEKSKKLDMMLEYYEKGRIEGK